MKLKKYLTLEDLKADFDKTEKVDPNISPDNSEKNLFVGITCSYVRNISDQAKTVVALGNIVDIQANGNIKIYVYPIEKDQLCVFNNQISMFRFEDVTLVHMSDVLKVKAAAGNIIEINNDFEII